MRKIPSTNEIKAYLHCKLCVTAGVDAINAGEIESFSPRDNARYSIGWTELGLQVWCNIHDCNIVHIDFENHRHPANLTYELPHKEKTG